MERCEVEEDEKAKKDKKKKIERRSTGKKGIDKRK